MIMIIDILSSFFGSFVAITLAAFLFYKFAMVKSKDPDTIREETPEDKRLFDEDCSAIVKYCSEKGLVVTIQPNYDNILWIFHHQGDEMFAICEMIPGTYVQMAQKINSYILHKEERQKEMRNAGSK